MKKRSPENWSSTAKAELEEGPKYAHVYEKSNMPGYTLIGNAFIHLS
jgi:hypothetical protein